MEELMAQHGIGNHQNSKQQKATEGAKRKILSSEARERFARIALVKPNKAREG
ncbi:hypothetical protein AAG906_004755 [Vitis piasezkii]